MVRMFVRHRVKNYETWRTHYDAAEPMRQSAGVLASGVYRSLGAHNEITVWHDFASATEAHAFMGRASLRDAMANAGVTEAPTVWLAEEV